MSIIDYYMVFNGYDNLIFTVSMNQNANVHVQNVSISNAHRAYILYIVYGMVWCTVLCCAVVYAYKNDLV